MAGLVGAWNRFSEIVAPLDEGGDESFVPSDFTDGFAPGSAVDGGTFGNDRGDEDVALRRVEALAHEVEERDNQIMSLTNQLTGLKELIREHEQDRQTLDSMLAVMRQDETAWVQGTPPAELLANALDERGRWRNQTEHLTSVVQQLVDEAIPQTPAPHNQILIGLQEDRHTDMPAMIHRLVRCLLDALNGTTAARGASSSPTSLTEDQPQLQPQPSINGSHQRQSDHAATTSCSSNTAVVLEQELARAQARVEREVKRAEALQAEVVEWTSRFDNERRQRQIHEKRIGELERDLGQVQGARSQAEKSAAEAQATMQQQAEQLRVALQQGAAVSEHAQLIAAKEHEIGQLKQIIAQLRNVKNSKAQDMEAVVQERAALRAQVQALVEEQATLRRESEEQQELIRRNEMASQNTGTLNIQLAEVRESASRAASDWGRKESELRSQLLGLSQRHQAAQKAAHDACTKLRATEADLALARQDHERASTACVNLQRVLEQFQSEKEAELFSLQTKHERALEAHNDAAHIQTQHLEEAHELELADKLKAIERLEQEVAEVDLKAMGELQAKDAEVQQMRRTLDEAVARLQNSRDDVVDRKLVTNLIVTYHTKHRSPEVLELTARMLNFTDEEKLKVGLRKPQGNLVGMLGNMIAPLPAPELPAEQMQNSNLLELWVAFLQAEAPDKDAAAAAATVATSHSTTGQLQETRPAALR